MKRLASLAALVLLMAGCKAKEFHLTLLPKLPKVAVLEGHPKLLLEDFGDDREGDEVGNLVGSFSQHGFDGQVRHSKGEKPVFLMYLDNAEPARLFHDKLKELLQDAGIEVLEGTAPAGTPRLGGRLHRFKIDFNHVVANVFELTVETEYRLRLAPAKGEALEKDLSGAQTRRTQNFGANKPIETVGREALEAALDQAADFLESPAFAKAMAQKK
jgi:hypothetical protein